MILVCVRLFLFLLTSIPYFSRLLEKDRHSFSKSFSKLLLWIPIYGSPFVDSIGGKRKRANETSYKIRLLLHAVVQKTGFNMPILILWSVSITWLLHWFLSVLIILSSIIFSVLIICLIINWSFFSLFPNENKSADFSKSEEYFQFFVNSEEKRSHV